MINSVKLTVNRVGWIESLRSFAMLMVIIPHFIAFFCPEVFGGWQDYPLLLKGINGKHGVAMFCVLLGYFASSRSAETFPTYIVRRYLQFAINIFIVLLPFVVFNSILTGYSTAHLLNGVQKSFIESVLFKNGLNPTLWCIRAMFFGSLLCFVLGNYCKMIPKWKELLLLFCISSFMYFIDVWLAICTLGVVLRAFLEMKFSPKKECIFCAISIVAIPFLYRRPESQTTYMLQGFSSCLLMYVCMYVSRRKWSQRIPKLMVFQYLGNVSFYLFLWHTPVNVILKSMDMNMNLWVLFAFSFSCSLFLSIIQMVVNRKWINPCNKRISIKTI